jgi:hypothetical protein
VPVGGVSTETQVHFVNAAVMGQLKICKALAPGSDVLDGQTFDFDVTRHADVDPPAGPTQRVSVRASATSTQCAIVGFFPVGEQVQVSEVAPGDYIDVAGEGVVTIATGSTRSRSPTAPRASSSSARRRSPGLTAQPTFRFRVDGGSIIPVRAGACTLPMRVAIGQHSVQELAENDYELKPDAPGGGLDVTPADRLVTRNVGLRTITVSVPYGATGETLVTVTNRVKQGWSRSASRCRRARSTPSGRSRSTSPCSSTGWRSRARRASPRARARSRSGPSRSCGPTGRPRS